MLSVKIENLTKTYEGGETVAVDDVSFTVKEGELFTLLGPSGCGKTTILHSIAGLVEPDEGEIWVGDELVTSREQEISVSPQERDIAMIFQNYALYPNMTVAGNFSFPLENIGMEEDEIEEKVEKTAELLGLEELLDRKPADLSGGQRQRVAVGRAIIRSPRAFLMDEPLGNLDAKLRLRMRMEIREIQKELGITTIYVTHDQTEATTISDRILLMGEEGGVEQVGTPDELFFQPHNLYVAEFIGSPPMNFVDCTLTEEDGGPVLDAGDFKIPVPAKKQSKVEKHSEEEVVLGIRPMDISEKSPKARPKYGIRGEITMVEPIDLPQALLHVKKGEHTIRAEVEGVERSQDGEATIEFDPSKIHIFDKKSGEALVNAETEES